MAASAMVFVDAELHQRAAEKLATVSMSVDDAVRQILSSVVEECGMPLSLHLPNADTRGAMEELEAGGGLKSASLDELFQDLRG